jgi:NADH dehydrogenase [ubiquinone] 1 alpha subcomplex assembly factor 3
MLPSRIVTRQSRVLSLNKARFKSFSISHSRYSSSSPPSNQGSPKDYPETDFGEMNVLGNAPPLAFAIESCNSDSFTLNNGLTVENTGLLLLGGEVFQWSQWSKRKMPLNIVGQWELPADTLGILELLWPKPGMYQLLYNLQLGLISLVDLLVIGTGARTHILSPNTRNFLSNLGIRVECCDTRNAAAQYNLLATERGIDEVGALLMPAGWKPTL